MRKIWSALGLFGAMSLAAMGQGDITNAWTVSTNHQFYLQQSTSTGLLWRVETTSNLIAQVWSNATIAGQPPTNQAGDWVLPEDGPQRFYRFAADLPTATDTYMVIDLAVGPTATNYPVSYTNEAPAGGWGDEYKTTKLVLRQIPAGTFTMGSPTNELGRELLDPGSETQHSVTLTQPFYVGVFEVTQKQWERVMGNWPSWFNTTSARESLPVEQVSYNDIRGTVAGTNWPADGNVDTDSFMGRLRTKTGQAFDLPTEAQWEYACRAGTTTALNSGYNLTNTFSDARMSEVGRYWYNQSVDTSGATAKAGSYLANAWGLYDMHGNVFEWCLDWYPGYEGWDRVLRGGSWDRGASSCRSAHRGSVSPSLMENFCGFRTVAPPPGQ